MDPDIAAGLRRHGIDVTTTLEMNLTGQADLAQLNFARSQRRVLVTDDADFLSLATRLEDHSGIVFCRRTKHTVGEIIRFLVLIHGVCEMSELSGAVEFM